MFKQNTQPAQASFHVKKGDEVVVISGANRGARGKILEVQRSRNRVLIENVNMIKKASRSTPNNTQGGIVEREGSIHISNVMLAAKFDASKRRSATKGA